MTDHELHLQKSALRWSFGVAFVVLILKFWAWRVTSSAAVFSDSVESVVHVAIGAFALFTFKLSIEPPDDNHHYGHGKIAFITSGIKGALILVATAVVCVESVSRLVHGAAPEAVGQGSIYLLISIFLNGALGLVLMRVGRKTSSLIVQASGKFVLADVWTTVGVVLGLGAYHLTGLKILDPLIALAFAVFLIVPGIELIRQSLGGLMDVTDRAHEQKVSELLTDFTGRNGLRFHNLRLRENGSGIDLDFHLQFPDDTSLARAHTLTTMIERQVAKVLGNRTHITTHIEPFTIPIDEQDEYDTQGAKG